MARATHLQQRWAEACQFSLLLIGLMILVAVLDWLLPIDLRNFGIVPRTVRGLVGIFLGPLLHLGFAHLFANAFPLFVLVLLLFADRAYTPQRTLGWIWVGSGLGTWLIGRGDAVHIGASSLVYGLVAYLVAAGWWMRSWRSILIAGAVLVVYGGIFYGLLPQRGIISWEGHLAGAIVGVWVAHRNHA